MRRFAASVFIAYIFLSGLYSQGNLPVYDPAYGVLPAFGDHFADTRDLLHSSYPLESIAAITGEEKIFAAQGRYPAISHRFDKTTAARLADNLLNNIRENYIRMSEFQVIRFEGPDIIQPYFYSW